MINAHARLHQLETRIMQWLVQNSITVLRVSLGFVFLAFGALKYFPGLSPAAALAERTVSALTFGLIPPGVGILLVATLECVIGLGLISGRYTRLTLLLMGFQLLGAMSPLFLFTGEMFSGPYHAPTLEAQYIIKDVVLVGAGFVIGATLYGGRIVAERVRRAEDYRSYVPGRTPSPARRPGRRVKVLQKRRSR